ncbi:MAG: YdcF family protein [Pyrinomonadaceae bacterium]
MSKRAKMLIAALILLTSWVLAAPFLANYLIVDKPLEHADAIIVLSGSAVYKERIQKAAELYKQGVAPRIFISNDGEAGGWSNADLRNPLYVELEQRQLIAAGVSPDAIIILPGIVSGTHSEAEALKNEVTERPINSVLIVTSAYHTRRALRTFEKILTENKVEIGIAHPPAGELTPSSYYWWLKPRGWQMVAGEYVKSVVYSFYY